MTTKMLTLQTDIKVFAQQKVCRKAGTRNNNQL